MVRRLGDAAGGVYPDGVDPAAWASHIRGDLDVWRVPPVRLRPVIAEPGSMTISSGLVRHKIRHESAVYWTFGVRTDRSDPPGPNLIEVADNERVTAAGVQ